MQLDLLPPDLAGMARGLQEYEFTSTEAREAFDELLHQLQQEVLQSMFNRMAGAMSSMTPEALQRTKDMFDALNRLLEMREAGVDTTDEFERFMQQYGDMFPGNPQTLDELLEQMAQSMAQMQQLLNSMTPEQRAQLQALAESLMEDMDLRWQVDQLSRNLQQAFPNLPVYINVARIFYEFGLNGTYLGVILVHTTHGLVYAVWIATAAFADGEQSFLIASYNTVRANTQEPAPGITAVTRWSTISFCSLPKAGGSISMPLTL